MIKGVDISNNNGYVDLERVRDEWGAEFCIAKTSQGTNFVDSYFPDNWARCLDLGLVRGAYHYAEPDRNHPEDEAEFFWGLVDNNGTKSGDLLALDLERGFGDLSNWAERFMAHLTLIAGWSPLFYSYPNFMHLHGLIGVPSLASYGLWYASYRDSFPATPADWPFIAIWQNGVADVGEVPGVVGKCDMNVFNGSSLAQLRAYGKGGIVPENNPYWEQIGLGFQAAMRANADEPTGPEKYYYAADPNGGLEQDAVTSNAPGIKGMYQSRMTGNGEWKITFTPWR